MNKAKLAGMLAMSLCLSACSNQRSTDYAGEPLAEVRGTIVTSSTASKSELKIAMQWTNFAGHGDTSSTVEVIARGAFPAKFTLSLRNPPPEAQLNDFTRQGVYPDEARVGVAPIHAVALNVGKISGETPILGTVEDYVVAYVDRDVLPGTETAAWIHGTLRAGFHLMKVEHVEYSAARAAQARACYAALPAELPPPKRTAACGEFSNFDKLHEATQGFDTEVTLKLAPEKELRFPNYF